MKYTDYLFLVIFLFCLDLPVTAQHSDILEQLEVAKQLTTSSHYDSALVRLDELLATLTPAEQRLGKSGLLIRLERTHALRRKRDYVRAAEELLPLIDDSQQAGEYAIQAEASLRMSLIHERQERPVESLIYIERGRKLIETHGIQTLNAYLFNRLAAYHRVFGDLSVARGYAWQSVLAAEEQKNEHQLALAYFNLSLIYQNSDAERSETYLKKAAAYYHHTGSAIDYLVMTLVLNDLHLRSGRLQEALEANDSAMVYAGRVIDRDSTYTSRVYQLRANLMKAMGEQDSAWHYLNLAHVASMDHFQKITAERAVEIESRYTNEKNNLLIAQQNRLLEFKQRREAWMGWTIAAALLGLLVLYYYYNRLSKANLILGEQAETINERNHALAIALEEQRMLQGEVHHRVKNNLQVIISLLELQIEELTDPPSQAVLSSMAGRIYSMAAVHETLYQDGQLGQIEFGKYLGKICDHFCQISSPPRGCRFTFDIPECWLNLETAIPLGTMLNELLTNSFKYAVAPDQPLCINVTLRPCRKGWCLEYRDNGPGFINGHIQEREGGLGTYLLQGMSHQLHGYAETSNEHGAVTRIYFQKKNDPSSASTSGSKKHYFGALT